MLGTVSPINPSRCHPSPSSPAATATNLSFLHTKPWRGKLVMLENADSGLLSLCSETPFRLIQTSFESPRNYFRLAYISIYITPKPLQKILHVIEPLSVLP